MLQHQCLDTKMTLEQAIKQNKPFQSVHQRAIVNLIYTHNWMNSRMKEFLKPYGITQKQFNVLRILKGAGKPISTSDIRERLLDQMSDVSRLVDRMIDKKLAVRNTCPKDKRLVDVEISDAGVQLLSTIKKQEQKINQLAQNISLAEAETLNKLLDKLRNI